MRRKDWLDFADKDKALAEFLNGPKDLHEIAPGMWGYKGGSVMCIGDRSHMRKISAKMFRDKFHAAPCPMGYYGKDHGGDPLPSVAERLAQKGGIHETV